MVTPGSVVDAEGFRQWVRRAARELERRRAEIDALNVFPVPDGDTGTNLWLTMTACQKAVEAVRGGDLRELTEAAARGALLGARGNSGVILSQFLRGLARYVSGLRRPAALDGRSMAKALEQAVAVAYEAVIRPVEGTMLTVGREASTWAARAARQPSATAEQVLAAALQGAREALRATPELLPLLKEAGVVDAGGQGLVVLLEAARCTGVLVEGEQGPARSVPVPAAGVVQAAVGTAVPDVHGPGGIVATDLVYRYCTEFVVRGREISAQRLRSQLEPLGDSLLVVGDSALVKCHLHTNHPGQALEVGLRWGELLSVSVSNMQEQNRQAAEARSAAVAANPTVERPQTADGPAAACAVVAVASGHGLAAIFRSLGAERVVDGGRTMNPSTEDLAAAVADVAAPAVVLLPNHPNVLMAAEQVKRLSAKRVAVVPTRSVPQGLAAMLAFRPDQAHEANVRAMQQAAARVRCGEVSHAVRDALVGGHQIRAGDLLGMVEGELVWVGSALEEAVREVARRLLTRGQTLLTLYYGQEVAAERATAIADLLRSELDGVEVELYEGGQPIYHFLLSSE